MNVRMDHATRGDPMRLNFGKISGAQLILAAAVGLGAFVRLLPLLSATFPLNDGGLFYRMTDDLIANGFRIPLVTTYNNGAIPFGYPPLGFYLLGGLHVLTGVPMLELMRWLPALFSLLSIPAVYLLARRLLPGKDEAALAVLIYALIPRSHEWILMGGGIARAPGMLFALLALVQAVRLLERPTWVRACVLGLLLGCAILSHLEMAWFAVFSLVLLVAFRARSTPVLARVAVALGLGGLLAGPWWIPLLANHGAAPLLQAALSGQHTPTSTAAIFAIFTGEPFQGFFLLLGLLAAIRNAARRDFLLPAWLVSIVVLDPRAAGTDASIPIGMLAATALTQIFLPSLAMPGGLRRAPGDSLRAPDRESGTRPRGFALAALAVACYGLYASVLAPFLPGSALRVSLRPGEIEAAEWINANLPDGNRLLVVSGREAWGADPLSEWLPALTDQVSLATPQGKEWVGGLGEAGDRHRALQRCAALGSECLQAWLADGGVQFDYLMVARYPTESSIQTIALQEGIRQSEAYAVVLSNSDTVIYERAAMP
jgi:Dolichyl-phosphate-mannose-protein mannosyltransferase